MKVTPGISFAIPIDYAKEFLNNSKQKRLSGKLNQHKRRRFLGITMLPITSQIIGELRSRMHIPAHVVNGIVVYRIGMSIFHIRGDTLRPLKIYLYEKLSDLANFFKLGKHIKNRGESEFRIHYIILNIIFPPNMSLLKLNTLMYQTLFNKKISCELK